MKAGIGYDRAACVSPLTKGRENHLTVFVRRGLWGDKAGREGGRRVRGRRERNGERRVVNVEVGQV